MLELVPKNNAIITSKAPQSAVTPQDIAAPYRQIAGVLDKVGEVTDELAVKAAKRQASEDLANQKIVRGEDGSVSVANPAEAPLLFGRASEAYDRAVMDGTVAQHANVISEHLNDLHAKNQADPQAFRAAVEAWSANYSALKDKTALGEMLRRQFDQTVTQHYNAVVNTASNLDIKRQGSALSASQESARGDITAMLRGGASLEDPAVKEKLAQFDQAIDARTGNPLFGYSAEQAALDRSSFHGEAVASRFLYDVDQTYKSTGDGGGYEGAMRKADSILTDPRFSMSQQLREQYYHRATAEIRANEATRRQSVSDAQSAFRELQLVSSSGGRIESNDVETIAKSFIAAGDPGGAARVRSYFIRKPLNDDFGRQPLAAQTQQIGAMHGMNAAQRTYQAFIQKGYSPVAAAGIIGNLIQENSTFDTALMGDGGTSGGLAQFHNERLTALKKFASDRGKPWTDHQIQIDYIDHELHTTEAGTLAKLQAATTPEDAAAAFIGYERPQGWTSANPAGGMGYQSRLRHARAIFERKPADMSMGPAGTLWLEANRANTTSSAAETEWASVMKAYNSEGVMPSAQKVTDIVNAATVSRNAALLDQIGQDTARINALRGAGRQPLTVMSAGINELQSMGARGDLEPAGAAVLSALEKRKSAIEEGLDKNPIQTTVANFPDRFKPPGPLDFSSEGALAGSLATRAAIAGFARDNWQTGQLSVLDQQDVRDLQTALGGPQGARVLLTMTNGLHPEELQKVFEIKDLSNTLVGLQSNPDAAKMSAANSVVDALWRVNPAMAENLFGARAIDKLHAWQGMKDSFSTEEIAQNLNAPRDPNAVRVREEARKAALTETEKLSPADVAYKLGAGSWLGGGAPPMSALPRYAATPGTASQFRYVPDGMAAGVLRDDYRQTYAALRADGVEADKASELAVERLRSTWGVSEASGGRLMKYPPEKYFPSIGGNHDWMADDLRAWVAAKVGPEFSAGRRGLETAAFAGGDRNWEIAGLISDSRTETEARQGRPSYIVAISRGDGTIALLGASPGEARVSFDPEAPISKHYQRLMGKQQRVQDARAAGLSLAMPLP